MFPPSAVMAPPWPANYGYGWVPPNPWGLQQPRWAYESAGQSGPREITVFQEDTRRQQELPPVPQNFNTAPGFSSAVDGAVLGPRCTAPTRRAAPAATVTSATASAASEAGDWSAGEQLPATGETDAVSPPLSVSQDWEWEEEMGDDEEGVQLSQRARFAELRAIIGRHVGPEFLLPAPPEVTCMRAGGEIPFTRGITPVDIDWATALEQARKELSPKDPFLAPPSGLGPALECTHPALKFLRTRPVEERPELRVNAKPITLAMQDLSKLEHLSSSVVAATNWTSLAFRALGSIFQASEEEWTDERWNDVCTTMLASNDYLFGLLRSSANLSASLRVLRRQAVLDQVSGLPPDVRETCRTSELVGPRLFGPAATEAIDAYQASTRACLVQTFRASGFQTSGFRFRGAGSGRGRGVSKRRPGGSRPSGGRHFRGRGRGFRSRGRGSSKSAPPKPQE